MNATRALIALGAVLVLGTVNFSILGKEGIKRNGEVIYLDLAPRDPRSVMQGDYMALRFRLATQIPATLHDGETGFADIVLDAKRVASVAPGGAPGKLRIRYRMRNGAVWLGTNAFFFEEGSEARFAPARYGEFRLDRDTGEAVLVGLRDASFNPL
jgi:uncharacterized membrane-anchored protein